MITLEHTFHKGDLRIKIANEKRYVAFAFPSKDFKDEKLTKKDLVRYLLRYIESGVEKIEKLSMDYKVK